MARRASEDSTDEYETAAARAGAAAPAPADYDAEGPRWFNAYFSLLERRGRWVVLFWVAAYAFGLAVGPSFLTLGNDAVNAPPGTPSAAAQAEFEARYELKSHELPLLVLVASAGGNAPLVTESPEMAAFARALVADVKRYNASEEQGNGNVIEVLSYFELEGTLLDGAKSALVSSDKRATFVNVAVRGDRISAERYKFVEHLQAFIDARNPLPGQFHVGLTGFDAMAYDSARETAEQVVKIDMVTVPIAMSLLGFMVRSWRLLLFSSFNLGCAILFSFALAAASIRWLGAPHPESASAQLMEVMTMAVSIDWSLFLNRRYRDEIKRGADPRRAAYRSLLHSGHVVVMSGLTLFVVFLGFIPLPAVTV